MYLSNLRQAFGFAVSHAAGRSHPLFAERYPSLTLVQIKILETNALNEPWWHRSLVGLDQFVNVVFGGNPGETISSRVRRVSDKHHGWSWNLGVWVAKGINGSLNLLQSDHGAKAQAGDLARADKVEKIEKKALGIG